MAMKPLQALKLGVPKPGYFKHVLYILHTKRSLALIRPLAPTCALLHTCACALLHNARMPAKQGKDNITRSGLSTEIGFGKNGFETEGKTGQGQMVPFCTRAHSASFSAR